MVKTRESKNTQKEIEKKNEELGLTKMEIGREKMKM